ncbi:MAG: universal stress protein [Chloroflexota bacterium]
MYKSILVPMDGSATAEAALDHAVKFAQAFRSTLVLFYVVPTSGVSSSPLTVEEKARIAEVDQYLKQYKEKLTKAGLKDVNWAVTSGDPAEEIIRYADRCSADLVVMGTHGRSEAFQWLFGSVASKVLQSLGIPVVILRPKAAVKPLPSSKK